jgi:hypothetical protein
MNLTEINYNDTLSEIGEGYKMGKFTGSSFRFSTQRSKTLFIRPFSNASMIKTANTE